MKALGIYNNPNNNLQIPPNFGNNFISNDNFGINLISRFNFANNQNIPNNNNINNMYNNMLGNKGEATNFPHKND